MDNVSGSHSKLINLITSGRLVVLSVLVMSLFAATAPATAQAISTTLQPSTYTAVYTSACQSNCATRPSNQNYGYSSNSNYRYTGSYRGGYTSYGSNYGYAYGSANYRNYNLGGMYRGYSPRIYSSYGNYYRSPSIGDYFGYFAGQYLQSRVNNRGNCVSANSCVVNYYNLKAANATSHINRNAEKLEFPDAPSFQPVVDTIDPLVMPADPVVSR